LFEIKTANKINNAKQRTLYKHLVNEENIFRGVCMICFEKNKYNKSSAMCRGFFFVCFLKKIIIKFKNDLVVFNPSPSTKDTYQNIKIKGFSEVSLTNELSQKDVSLKIVDKSNNPIAEINSPLEYVLAGFAACVNAVGRRVAMDQRLHLKSIHIEVIGTIEQKKSNGIKTRSRAGFQNIDIRIKPDTEASLTEIKIWLDELKERCPIYDNLLNPTLVNVIAIKEFKQPDVA